MKRILFTEEDFDKLVGGEVVKKDELRYKTLVMIEC